MSFRWFYTAIPHQMARTGQSFRKRIPCIIFSARTIRSRSWHVAHWQHVATSGMITCRKSEVGQVSNRNDIRESFLAFFIVYNFVYYTITLWEFQVRVSLNTFASFCTHLTHRHTHAHEALTTHASNWQLATPRTEIQRIKQMRLFGV